MVLRAAGAALAAVILTACVTAPSQPGAPAPYSPEPVPSEAIVRPLAALPGWEADDHASAFDAFRQGCEAARDPHLAEVCRQARAAGPLDRDHARGFFETHFVAEPIVGVGVLTGYFAPEYPARRGAIGEFSAPVRPRPANLKQIAPYPDRSAIEATPAKEALAWMRPEDLFFLQVQGSGVLTFEDGTRAKARYAASNGRPFVAIAGPMRQRGLLAAANTTADAIHAWLAAHRGAEADEIMRLNPRYAFFSLVPDDGRPPAGAAHVPLPDGRALAVDLARHSLGDLFWVDADRPLLAGARPSYRRLALALDTGGAITGEVRADLYVGQGAAAGAEAGRVRHRLKLYRLVPR